MIASIVGAFFVRSSDSLDSHALAKALHRGTNVAMAITIVAVVILGYVFFADVEGVDRWWGLAVSVIGGLVVGFAIGKVAEIWTSADYKPVKQIARQAETGPATTVFVGHLVRDAVGRRLRGAGGRRHGPGLLGGRAARRGIRPLRHRARRRRHAGHHGIVVSVDAYGPDRRQRRRHRRDGPTSTRRSARSPTRSTHWATPPPPSARASPSARPRSPPWRCSTPSKHRWRPRARCSAARRRPRSTCSSACSSARCCRSCSPP